MNSPTLKTPVAASAIAHEWIALRREIIFREGYATRAGAINTIEFKARRRDEWLPLLLPGDVTRFETAQGRDSVLAQLQHRE